MPRGRARGYDGQREQILRRAARLFAQRGYTATSMNDVAEACGVSKPSLYHYVDDKHGLLAEICAAHIARLKTLVEDVMAEPEAAAPRPAEQRLRSLIGAFMHAYAGAQAEHRVLTEDVKFLAPLERRRVLEGEREVVAAFADAIAAARPELAEAALDKPLTMLLFGMMNWLFTWLKPGGTLTHEAMAPVVADLFFGGLHAVAVAPTRARRRLREGTRHRARHRATRHRARRAPPSNESPFMSDLSIVQSLIADRWFGTWPGTELASAIDGTAIVRTHADAIDFGQALRHARETGGPALLTMDFQQRAARLRALAAYLNERKEALYDVSRNTGATRSDGWVDIEGGTGTLYAYASMGSNELPSGNLLHEGPAVALGKKGRFSGTHILVPRGGVAVHINAFNFPVWGLLEKFAPTFLAGMPCIAKPATATSYLSEAAVRLMTESGLLPPGSLQLVIGSTGDLLDRLESQDVVTFTGSADTALKLRGNANLLARSIPFNAEADSLNAALLGPDVTPDDEEFDLFVKEVVREMTMKAGQKCTAIRRAIVPRKHVDALAEKLRARLARVSIGDPAVEGVKMGALASKAQQRDVAEQVQRLAHGNEFVFGGDADRMELQGEGVSGGSFFQPTLLLCRDAMANDAVHDVEAFGPVSTLMPYDDFDEALALAARGRGSLVATLVTHDPKVAARAIPRMAAWHGRLLVLDREAAAESTGHGSPLPMLKHGGPGRAGGGEELGGLRAVKHYLQRAALQGSPTMLAAVTGEHVRGAARNESDVHPFRKHFEDLAIGDSLLTHRRTVSEADIVAFGGISGDYFYMHFDAIAARESAFGQRIAHGYFVLSAAAGLFVSPAPGPVLANYGLDNLRFVKPVAIGDTIRARLTCKRKIDRNRKDAQGRGQGVVAWDVEVTNQADEVVASYDILTLVAKRSDGAKP